MIKGIVREEAGEKGNSLLENRSWLINIERIKGREGFTDTFSFDEFGFKDEELRVLLF